MPDWLSMEILLAIAGGVVLTCYALPRLVAVLRAAPPTAGDASEGVVVFAESLRWLGVRWGRCEVDAGLRRGGYRGEFRFWDWDPTWRALLVLPTIAARRFLEAESQRLADHLAALRRRRPDLPIHLMGYSCGGYIALRALELLPEDARVDSCTLLAAAVSPWRDLNPAARRVSGPIVVTSSPLDVVVGLGTLLVGTADRRFAPSLGALGCRGPRCEKVRPVRWRPRLVRLGHWGGHFTTTAERFIARCVVPAAGITAS